MSDTATAAPRTAARRRSRARAHCCRGTSPRRDPTASAASFRNRGEPPRSCACRRYAAGRWPRRGRSRAPRRTCSAAAPRTRRSAGRGSCADPGRSPRRNGRRARRPPRCRPRNSACRAVPGVPLRRTRCTRRRYACPAPPADAAARRRRSSARTAHARSRRCRSPGAADARIASPGHWSAEPPVPARAARQHARPSRRASQSSACHRVASRCPVRHGFGRRGGQRWRLSSQAQLRLGLWNGSLSKACRQSRHRCPTSRISRVSLAGVSGLPRLCDSRWNNSANGVQTTR